MVSRTWAAEDPKAFFAWFGRQESPAAREGAALGFRNNLLPMSATGAIDYHNALDRSEVPNQVSQSVDQIVIAHLLDRDVVAAMEFAISNGSASDTVVYDALIRLDRSIVEKARFDQGQEFVTNLIESAQPERVDAALKSFVDYQVVHTSPQSLFEWIDNIEIEGDGKLRTKLESQAFTSLMAKNLPAAKLFLEKNPPVSL